MLGKIWNLIVGHVVQWIEAFLCNRQQRVVLGKCTSDWVHVTSRVPQGSVLGPTLFAAYINDLPGLLNNTCLLYADDLKIIAMVETIEQINSLQADLTMVSKWCSEWLMSPNVSKSAVSISICNNQYFSKTSIIKQGESSWNLIAIKFEKLVNLKQ